MALRKADVTQIAEVPNPGAGGKTYVVWTEEDGVRALCFRTIKKKPGYCCENDAGYGTSHLGIGACKFHEKKQVIDGPKTGRRRAGRYAKAFQGEMKQRYLQYLNDPHLLDLADELAAQRVVLMHSIEQMGEIETPEQEEWAGRVITIADKVSAMVERIIRSQATQVVTWSLMQYMVARIVDILKLSLARFLIDYDLASPEDVDDLVEVYGKQYYVPQWKRHVKGGQPAERQADRWQDKSEADWRQRTIDHKEV